MELLGLSPCEEPKWGSPPPPPPQKKEKKRENKSKLNRKGKIFQHLCYGRIAVIDAQFDPVCFRVDFFLDIVFVLRLTLFGE